MKIAITGHKGFIGSHLFKFLKNQKDFEVFVLDENNHDLLKKETLKSFVKDKDIIIHLAGINRDKDIEILKGNVLITYNLISAIKEFNSSASLFYGSSVQAEENFSSIYGTSKKLTEVLLEKFSQKYNLSVGVFRFSNVFGENCKPFYNSVIATFSHQIANNQELKVNPSDKLFNFIYVSDVIKKIMDRGLSLLKNPNFFLETVESEDKINITDLAKIIESFKNGKNYYNIKNIINVSENFYNNLFKTYNYYFKKNMKKDLEIKKDERGILIEIFKFPELGQVFYSTSKPGITRGNHYHNRKVEKFCVLKGEALLKLRDRETNHITEYKLTGEHPSVIDIPINYTHNITNTGQTEMFLLIWVNEVFNPEDPDTFYEEV